MTTHLQLYELGGSPKFNIPISSKAVYKGVLMEEFYLSLDFNLVNPINFKKGDYATFDGLKFEIIKISKPSFNAQKACYSYNLRLDWEITRWKNKVLFYSRQKSKEAAWKLTGFISQFAAIVDDNLSFIGFGQYHVSISSDLENVAKYIEFSNTSIWDALTQIAEEWDAEWWVEGYEIKIGKCQYGAAIDFEIGGLISNISPESTSKDEAFTRIFVFGSTKNLTSNYRPDDNQEVEEGIVERRLKLPERTGGFLDLSDGLTEAEIVEGIVIFDDVFPRESLEVTEVKEIEATETVDNGDGTSTEVKWTAYRIKLSGITFKKEYLMEGKNPSARFESGNLAGLDFECKWNPENKKVEEGEDDQIYEIIRNENYGAKLPNQYMHPAVGDKLVLYDINIKMVSDQLIPDAEEELYERGTAWLKDSVIDTNNYSCQTQKVRCAGYTRNEKGDLVYEKSNEVNLNVGQAINLISGAYFVEQQRFKDINGVDFLGKDGKYYNGAAGSRLSRIYSFEKKIANKFDATYVVGEAPKYSRLRALQQQISSIQLKGTSNASFTITGGGSSGGATFYVIKRIDPTEPTESNVYSAIRARDEFLSRKEKDTALEEIYFKKGLKTLNAVVEEVAQTYDLEVSHVATIFRTIVKDYCSSDNFIPGFTGMGMKLYQALNGDWNLELDNIIVRKAMSVFELIIQKIRSVNGAIAISQANGKVTAVTDTGTHYKLDFDNDYESFQVGDFVRCQQFKGSHVKYYWVRVDRLDGYSILLKKSDFTLYTPEVGDDVVQMGSDRNYLRQSLIYLSADESGRPTIDVLNGINSPSFEGKLKARMGCLDGIVDSDFPSDYQPSGYGFYGSNVFLKGVFVLRNGKAVDDELTTLTNNLAETERTAQAAEKAAQEANALLADIASDDRLTPNEKTLVLKEWDTIRQEYPKYVSQASLYDIASTAYTTAYTNLYSYITPLLQTLTTTNDIDGDVFRAKFASYYDARQNLLNAIALKAKQLADAASEQASLVETKMNTNFSVLQGQIAMGIQKSISYSSGAVDALKATYEAKKAASEKANADYQAAQESYDATVKGAYADGIVTSAEEQAIANAKANVETKKTAADLAASQLETAAQNYQAAQEGIVKNFVDTQIEVVSGKITLGVSEAKEYTNSAIGNLKLGVENLLDGTSTGLNWSKTSFDSSLKAFYRSNSTTKENYISQDFYTKAPKDGVYTISFSAKRGTNSGGTFEISVLSQRSITSTFVVLNKGLSLTEEYVFFEIQVTLVAGEGYQIRFDNNGSKPATLMELYVKEIKLEFGSKSTTWSPSINDVNLEISEAKDSAANAITLANNAQNTADDAALRLSNWASDGVISPPEKQDIKNEIAFIDGDKEQIVEGYSKYSLGTPSNYISAYNKYRGQLVTLSASTPENVAIPSTFGTNQTTYYSRRTEVLNAIASAAKSYSDTVSGNALTTAKSYTDSQIKIVSDQISLKVNKTDFDNLGNRVTEAESQIQINTDNINSRVTKTEFNNLELPVRNLITNSNFRFSSRGFSSTTSLTMLRYTTGKYEGPVLYGSTFLVFAKNSYSAVNRYSNYVEVAKLVGGKTYTFIYWGKSAGDFIQTTNYFFIYNSAGEQVKLSSFPRPAPSALYKKISVTFTCPGSETDELYTLKIRFGIYQSSSQGDAWHLVNAMMLVEGDRVPKDWVPAPEDSEQYVQDNYPTKTTFESEISQLSNQISLKVSQSDFNALGTRVSEAEVKLQPSNIVLAVRENSYSGGDNLAIGSYSGKGWSYSAHYDSEFRRDNATTSENYIQTPSYTIKTSGTYILSFYMKCSSNLNHPELFFNKNGDYHFIYKAWPTSSYLSYTRVQITTSLSEGDVVFFRFANNGTNNGSTASLYIKEFKLEKGDISSGWSIPPEDVSSDAQGVIQEKLYDTGINIDAKTVTVTASSFKVQNNAGTAIAVFKTASNGNPVLQAPYIDVDNLTVKKLDGATGSFKNLTCVDSSGNTVGTLTFDSSGRLWFNGDMYHQGTKNGRSLRYYMSDVWVRGAFACSERIVMVVQGSYAYVYAKGATGGGTYIPLTSATSSNNEKYYNIPMYSPRYDYAEDLAGLPVDTVIFKITSSTTYRYNLGLAVGQRATLINANNNYNNVNLFTNGIKVTLNGGSMHVAMNVLNFLYPSPASNLLGRGILFGGSNDNNW